MAKNATERQAAASNVPQTTSIACDWCAAPCKPSQITLMSGAKLCQGCASYYYHGDDEDEGDAEEKKNRRR